MNFIDECSVKLFAGAGGDGCVDFDGFLSLGGSGGNGGSIYFIGTKKEKTLINISTNKEYFATNGKKGGQQNAKGESGNDLLLPVPFGTKIFVENKLIKTINSNEPFLIAKGGLGGKGNKATDKRGQKEKNYIYEKGAKGQFLECELKLDTIADVGFIGKPSAGKSTILSVISKAKPKIANYDFTTLKPQLGLVRVSSNKSFVAVDLPGLIARDSIRNKVEEETLQVISKCKIIAYVLDFGDAFKDPIKDFQELKKELKNYSQKLEKLPIIVIANKMDSSNFYEKLKLFSKVNTNLEIIRISALQKKNINELKYKIFNIL